MSLSTWDETREGSPCPRGSNGQCDRVWDKLYPPISVACSKWFPYKESPLCSWGSALGCESSESLLACLTNLLSESFGALSLCLSPPETLGILIY
jgi:hypothetical protein